MSFCHKGNHSAMQNTALRGALAILFALSNFCVAECVFDAHLGFGGNDLDIHPELSTIIFNDSDVCSVNATNGSWSVRVKGHVLFYDCHHPRRYGESAKVLAGSAFFEMLSQFPRSAFQAVCRENQRGLAAVCDPNPPRPFARYRFSVVLEREC